MGQSKNGSKNEKAGIRKRRRYSPEKITNDERGGQEREQYVSHMEKTPEKKISPCKNPIIDDMGGQETHRTEIGLGLDRYIG